VEGPDVVVFNGSGITLGVRAERRRDLLQRARATICLLFFDVALGSEETSYTIEIAGLNRRAHMHEERAEENWLVTRAGHPSTVGDLLEL
jgi:hypothetical protein